MNALPVLGAPLHWPPVLLALTAIAVTPGIHLLASPLLEGRKVTWRDDYAAVLVGDPLLALAVGLGADLSQPGGPRGWPASWIAGCAWLAGGWTFGLWQSRREFVAGRYTVGQILSPTKLWHQFVVYPLLGYWVTATVLSGLGAAGTPRAASRPRSSSPAPPPGRDWPGMRYAIPNPATAHSTGPVSTRYAAASHLRPAAANRKDNRNGPGLLHPGPAAGRMMGCTLSSAQIIPFCTGQLATLDGTVAAHWAALRAFSSTFPPHSRDAQIVAWAH